MNDFTLDNVNEMYIDVLREIGNIGAGNATTSLASMINEQIDMNVPKVELMEASKLSSAICPEDEIIVGIFLEVTHDITGSMMFLMRMDSAHYLVNKLMGRDPEFICHEGNRKYYYGFVSVCTFKYDKSYDFTIRSIYCGGYGGSDS